jgi:hypothetical protein
MCCIEVIQVIRPALTPWYRVFYLPSTSCSKDAIIAKRKSPTAYMAMTRGAIKDSFKPFI